MPDLKRRAMVNGLLAAAGVAGARADTTKMEERSWRPGVRFGSIR
jgi:hypothetical protein